MKRPKHHTEEMEKNTRSLDWKQEKLRGSTVRCARGHLRGKPWLRYTFSWEQLFFRGLTKKNFFFGESHNSENFTKKYSLSYWSRALSNFSFLVFRFSGPHTVVRVFFFHFFGGKCSKMKNDKNGRNAHQTNTFQKRFSERGHSRNEK